MQELDAEIAELKQKLKMCVLEQQEREMQDSKMYTYLHSLLGARLMEQLDRKLENGSEE